MSSDDLHPDAKRQDLRWRRTIFAIAPEILPLRARMEF
jgi:hypothetical protein